MRVSRGRELLRGGSLLVLFLTAPASVWAQSAAPQTADPTRRFAASPVSGEFVPAIPVGSQRQQTVVLKLAGDPVAVVRSRMPWKRISEAHRRSIERDLRAQQDAIAPAIEAMGGQVMAKFQHAINGIKVRATPDQIAFFAKLPGVIQVKPVRTYHLDNAQSVPFIGTPGAWQGPPGLHGEHVKVASIDTGIDFTHANFGGPGTVAAFNAAFAASTLPADPALFGPNAPKVKGGTDLVGDNYDASSSDPAKNTPRPDPNPLDCNGHGSHTAGTLAGFGVTSAGATFKGPYDATTPSQSFTIGPGVAPLADLYAVRVFGCSASATTQVVVDAIDWAVAHGMQVISMSLGAPFGSEEDADAEVSENAVKAGVVVVVSAGNNGSGAYIAGTPSTGDKVISAAAVDSHQSFPGATLALAPSGSIVAQNSNGAAFSNGTSLGVVVLRDGSGGVSLGCDPAEYIKADVVGKLVVTTRGTCARVARAIFGQQAGAAAVAMINNAAGYPPFEGPITSNPDTGIPFNVTIPFLGIKDAYPTSADGIALTAASSASLTNTTIANPTFRRFASFTSGGPRLGDGHLKPDISAPGVSVFSTAIGTGNQGLFLSGTSTSAPHVAGSAALAIQAHPDWDADEVATAIVNTADASQVVGFSARLGGNGLVQPLPATRTSVIARAGKDSASANFGVAEFASDFTDEKNIKLRNLDRGSATFSVSSVKGPGSPHSVTVGPSAITVSGHEQSSLHLKLSVPVATVGDSSALRQVQGRVTLTPLSGNGGAALSVPYYFVPRGRSLVEAKLRGDFDREDHSHDNSSGTVRLKNESASVAGTADFYAWGLRGHHRQLGAVGLRAVGAQSFVVGSDALIVFAVSTFAPWSNAATEEFDILLDVNGNGVPDFDVVSVDLGLLTTGSFNGQPATAVINLRTGRAVVRFLTDAPTNGNTLLMPFFASDIGLSAQNPRLSYIAFSFDLLGTDFDRIITPARFNAFHNSVSTGAFVTLAPGATASVPIFVDPAEFAVTPAVGIMVVSLDNFAEDNKQALLLRLFEKD